MGEAKLKSFTQPEDMGESTIVEVSEMTLWNGLSKP